MRSSFQTPTFRENNFDFLRFFLASLVILSHAYAFLGRAVFHGKIDEPLRHWSHNGMTFGELAVDGFFVISGVLITRSWLGDPRLFDYLAKRVLRIYPAFVVNTLICSFLIAPIATDGTLRFSSLDYLGNVLVRCVMLRPTASGHYFSHLPFPGQINSSAWTIHYEFICYLALAALGLLGLLRKRAVIACMLAVSFIFYILFVTHGDRITLPWLLQPIVMAFDPWSRFFTYFLIGALFYLHRDRIPRSPLLASTAMLLLAVSLRVSWGLHLALPTAGAYLLLYVAFAPHISFRSFGKYGDFSYGIYLYSAPIMQLLVFFAGPQVFQPIPFFILSLALSIAAGMLSWHLIEKPFLKLKPHPTAPLPEARARKSRPTVAKASTFLP